MILLATLWFCRIQGKYNVCDGDTSRPNLHMPKDTLDETFYQLPQIIDSSDVYPRPKEERLRAHIAYLAGNRRCVNPWPPFKNRTQNASANHPSAPLPIYLQYSTCPSFLVINHDENRIPTELVENVCSCRKCGERSNCRSIYYFRRVFRRRCNKRNKKYQYSVHVEPIRVGCTCVENSRYLQNR